MNFICSCSLLNFLINSKVLSSDPSSIKINSKDKLDNSASPLMTFETSLKYIGMFFSSLRQGMTILIKSILSLLKYNFFT